MVVYKMNDKKGFNMIILLKRIGGAKINLYLNIL